MDPTPHFPAEQCLMLNDVARIIASRRNLSDLFHDLAERLHRLVDFSYLGVMLYDPTQHVLQLHTLESAAQGPLRPGATYAVDDIPSGWVWQHQQPLVIGDLAQETRFPQAMQALREHGLHSQEAQALQQQLAHERDRLRLLLEVTNSVVANLELRDVLRTISATLRRVMHCDVAGVQLLEAKHHQLRAYALDFPDSQGCIQEDILMPLEDSLPGQALQTGQPVVIDRADPAEVSCLIAGEDLQSHCFLPLISRQGSLGVLGLGRRQVDPVWVDIEGDTILVCTGANSLKAKNTKRDARVGLSVIAADNPYKEAQIRGRVVEQRPDPDFTVIDRVSRKYTGSPFPWRDKSAERLVLVIAVERVRSATLPFVHAPV